MPFYDSFYAVDPTLVGRHIARRIAQKLLDTIIKHKPERGLLLELGPGRGEFAVACHEKSVDYTCADVNLDHLRKLSTPGMMIQALIPPLPFASDTFDVTFAANLLEHMVDFHSASLLLQEMSRVVRPGGLVCHRVPDAMAWGMHFWNGDYTHSFVTTKRRVSQLYLDNGLQIEGLYSVSGPFLGTGAGVVSIFGKLIPGWIVDNGANPRSRLSKIVYSAKTTFLLGFLIIGRKVV